MTRCRLVLSGAALAAVVALGSGARDVAACGGLVAPNGSVRLARASTLVAWHGGVEHYMTSFAYRGDASSLGWIVPLPAVPDDVTKGGAWTLQRLARESQPLEEKAFDGALAAGAAAPAVVLRTTVIDALDITVLSGSGQAVIDWSAQNHFALNAETRAHLLAYAAASPVFMAARYDLQQARLRNTFAGDGTPVLITMHTPRLWVPLEVLANADDRIDADVYLLTDTSPTVAGFDLAAFGAGLEVAPGMTLTRQEPMNDSLRRDLASDRNMSWIPEAAWFTALRIGTTGQVLSYDMAVAPGGELATMPMGTTPAADGSSPAIAAGHVLDSHTTVLALGVAGGAAGLILISTLGLALAGRRASRR